MASKKSFGIEKLTPVLIIVSIVLAFAVGVLWQKVQSLESGAVKSATSKTVEQDPQEAVAAAQKQAPALGKISDDQAEKLAEVTTDDHIRGNPDAPLTIIEYSDFNCPYCGKFHETAKQVLDEYEDDVRWVYRHFSYRMQKEADSKALASECAADLGGNDAFWEFADVIFEGETDLEAAASEVGVNASAFNDCLESGEFSDEVEQDYQSGIEAGVTGTPGNFIVNESGETWFVPGAYPFEQIQSYIQEALQ
ncbi:DsbA family protein [Candidatus Woesebacteria bacterium]|nr:DsbA family protein [Candidatus Woesebacteria bacterium]